MKASSVGSGVSAARSAVLAWKRLRRGPRPDTTRRITVGLWLPEARPDAPRRSCCAAAASRGAPARALSQGVKHPRARVPEGEKNVMPRAGERSAQRPPLGINFLFLFTRVTTQDSFVLAPAQKYQENAIIMPRTSGKTVLASAKKPPPGTTTCAGRPSFARRGGSRRQPGQLDLSAHTWRWARRGKKRREMPHVQQGSYGPPGADNMPRTAGAKRPTAALASLVGVFATRAAAASEQKCKVCVLDATMHFRTSDQTCWVLPLKSKPQNSRTWLPPPTHNREPYDTLLYCPTSCPYRSVCGTDAACRLQF